MHYALCQLHSSFVLQEQKGDLTKRFIDSEGLLTNLPCSARAGLGSLDTSKQIIGSTYLSVFGRTKTDVLATISGSQNTKNTALAGLTFFRILISTCGENIEFCKKDCLV